MTNPKSTRARFPFQEIKKPEQCSDLAASWKDMEPQQILASLRIDFGYTLAEISELSSYPQGTVETWSSGRFTPKKHTISRLIEIFSSPNVPPSGKIRREMLDVHHLSWDAAKGWRFRYTLELNKKTVGKRIQQWLKTFDRKEAIERRDLIATSFTRLGLGIAGRIQKRKHSKNAKESHAGGKPD